MRLSWLGGPFGESNLSTLCSAPLASALRLRYRDAQPSIPLKGLSHNSVSSGRISDHPVERAASLNKIPCECRKGLEAGPHRTYSGREMSTFLLEEGDQVVGAPGRRRCKTPSDGYALAMLNISPRYRDAPAGVITNAMSWDSRLFEICLAECYVLTNARCV